MVYLETFRFGSPELGFETTQQSGYSDSQHTLTWGSGQESRGSIAPHDLQHPRMHR